MCGLDGLFSNNRMPREARKEFWVLHNQLRGPAAISALFLDRLFRQSLWVRRCAGGYRASPTGLANN